MQEQSVDISLVIQKNQYQAVTYLTKIKYNCEACVMRQLNSKPNPSGPSTQTENKQEKPGYTNFHQKKKTWLY